MEFRDFVSSPSILDPRINFKRLLHVQACAAIRKASTLMIPHKSKILESVMVSYVIVSLSNYEP